MNYDLRCEGLPMDDNLYDELLLCGRRFVLEIGGHHTVQMTLRQEQGFVQSHVELELPTRKLSSMVRRRDPLVSMRDAIDALRGVLLSDPYADAM